MMIDNMKYVSIQPPQTPPGNPGGVNPRTGQPVPIAGTAILILAALLLGFYFIWKNRKTKT